MSHAAVKTAEDFCCTVTRDSCICQAMNVPAMSSAPVAAAPAAPIRRSRTTFGVSFSVATHDAMKARVARFQRPGFKLTRSGYLEMLVGHDVEHNVIESLLANPNK